jgi:hypothetical protein
MHAFEYTVSVHGTTFFAERSGPGALRNFQDIHWTDQQGLRRGGGVEFRGEPGTDNYFHASIPLSRGVPIPNPYLAGEFASLGATWTRARLFFQLRGAAKIFHVGLFDGETRFHDVTRRPSLGVGYGAEILVPRERRRSINRAAGLSVGIRFDAPESGVYFEAAHATFETVFLDPSDPGP